MTTPEWAILAFTIVAAAAMWWAATNNDDVG
jgi:hypothetical protein